MLPVIAGIFGLAALFLATNWDSVKKWAKELITNIREAFATEREGAYAGMMDGKKVDSKKDEIRHQLFYKENNQWMKQTTTCQVDESEVPPFIREKIAKMEGAVDITDDMSKELKMEI